MGGDRNNQFNTANNRLMTQEDQLFRSQRPHIVDFAFDEAVAEVFPDMIRRSVPGFETVIPITGLIAAEGLPEGGLAFDLGCSQGATTMALLRALGSTPCRIVAVDSSAPMLDPRVTFRLEDIRQTDVAGASILLMNYVLQFIAPADRQALLDRCGQAMLPGGLVILSEKIRFSGEADQAWSESLHIAYKKANGYSELEVSQKREALERVMIVDTEAEHRQRLEAAGFKTVRTWFRCLNWCSIVAIKET